MQVFYDSIFNTTLWVALGKCGRVYMAYPMVSSLSSGETTPRMKWGPVPRISSDMRGGAFLLSPGPKGLFDDMDDALLATSTPSASAVFYITVVRRLLSISHRLSGARHIRPLRCRADNLRLTSLGVLAIYPSTPF